MSPLPDFLISGEIARLIPVIADSRKEQRVVSVFLATFSAVPSFAQALLAPLGQRLGQRSVTNTFTETVLNGDEKRKDRPDGLIQISTGAKKWSALVEAKIGNAELNAEQVQRYLQLARDNKLNAVITISNQFVARPDHNPISVPKFLTKRIPLYHWSWKFILTEAMLQQTRGLVTDPEQAFILHEFIRFLSHDSVGVTGFDQMPSEWRALNTHVKSGASLKRTAPEIEAVVQAWHQETRDLALRMSRHLAVDCELRLPRAHSKDPEQRLKDDCSEVAARTTLDAELSIPNAASVLCINVDLKAQTIRVGMQVDAPQDKQRPLSRVNWLLRQLKDVEEDNIFVRIIWTSRAQDVVVSLNDLIGDAKSIMNKTDQVPRAFEIYSIRDDGRRFSGRRTFIEELEHVVPLFYDRIGQHLDRWRPKPPQPVEKTQRDEAIAKGQDVPSVPKSTPVASMPDSAPKPSGMPGNKHTDLLEIPQFLLRFRRS